MVTKDVIRFPAERTARPARVGASVLDLVRDRLREWLGRGLNMASIPGVIAATDIHDQTTGQHIAIAVSALSVRLTVNGRDFYFDRLTGRFRGAGSGLL
jgi:hypothetical protein